MTRIAAGLAFSALAIAFLGVFAVAMLVDEWRKL